MAPLLEIRSVVKRFGGVAAVGGVSLALEPGRIYGLIGPNGSGKTTLFNCITGVDRADEGQILFKGRRTDRLKPHQIFHLGVGRTFQVIRVFPELTALENLLVVTTGTYAEAQRRARELLALVKLERLAGEFAGNLSYGQQKLVELAQVLMLDPQLILLDLVMPQMNGWQFLDERKRSPNLSRIPVLVMTSLWDARLPGKTQVLHKPFQPPDLFRSVRQALAAPAPA